MTLEAFMSVLTFDTRIHVIVGDRTLFYGRVDKAHEEIPQDTIRSLELLYARDGLNGLFAFTKEAP